MLSLTGVPERITDPWLGRDVARRPSAGQEPEPERFSLPLTESCQHRRGHGRRTLALTHLVHLRIDQKVPDNDAERTRGHMETLRSWSQGGGLHLSFTPEEAK